VRKKTLTQQNFTRFLTATSASSQEPQRLYRIDKFRTVNLCDVSFNAVGMEDVQGTPLIEISLDDFSHRSAWQRERGSDRQGDRAARRRYSHEAHAKRFSEQRPESAGSFVV
jgi:hypothetical protein